MNSLLLRSLMAPLPEGSDIEQDDIAHYLDFYGINLVAKGIAQWQTLGTFEAHGEELVGHVFQAPNAQANALVVHGYLDHVGLYGKLIEHLLSLNINVFMVDLQGHGISSGERASIDSFFHYTDALTQFLELVDEYSCDAEWFLLGQSMGGALSMTLNMLYPDRFAKMVLLAPLIRPYGWLVLRQAHSVLRPFVTSIPRTFHGNSHDEDFNDFLANKDKLQAKALPVAWISAMREWKSWLLNQPANPAKTLMLQGTEDPTVDWHYSIKKVPELFTNTDVRIIPEARHHMINEAPPYIHSILHHIYTFLELEDDYSQHA